MGLRVDSARCGYAARAFDDLTIVNARQAPTGRLATRSCGNACARRLRVSTATCMEGDWFVESRLSTPNRGARRKEPGAAIADRPTRCLMLLDGLDITDDCTLELVNRLRRADFAHQADTIEGALVSGQSEVSLTIPDRVAILAVLDDPPKGLAELRAALLSERVWRRSEGIS